MSTIPAFLPLVLRWKPVEASDAQVVANAYCLLEITDQAAIALLERKVGAASIVRLGARSRLHIIARTDARGVIMTVPGPGAGAPDALSPSALAPLLFPVATALTIWWTDRREIFDEVLELERAGGPQRPLARATSVNVIALTNALMTKDHENPSVLKTMTNLHGFVEGIEGTYRILSDTAETQLGVTLKSIGKLLVPVSVYLSIHDTWSQFQAGDAIATLLSTEASQSGFLRRQSTSR